MNVNFKIVFLIFDTPTRTVHKTAGLAGEKTEQIE
jgi:hypothetical protein